MHSGRQAAMAEGKKSEQKVAAGKANYYYVSNLERFQGKGGTPQTLGGRAWPCAGT